jgi:hypothetical protein
MYNIQNYCIVKMLQGFNTSYENVSGAGQRVRYGLDGPGIEFRWGSKFSAPIRISPGAHTASCKMGTRTLSQE